MRDNCDPFTHGIKRSLSVYEKSSLPTTTGRGLVLPAYPPAHDGQVGELDELMAVGYDGVGLVGVERDADIADQLYDHYYDRVQIHREELETFFTHASARFSYLHLDFCSYLSEPNLRTIEGWRGHVEPVARLRVSLTQTRRQRGQMNYEKTLQNKMMNPLLTLLGLEPPPEAESDSTQLVGVIMALNFFFGLRAWPFADLCAATPTWPATLGTHLLTNLCRFTYREVRGYTQINTIWVDVVPLNPTALASPEVAASYLRPFFAQLLTPIPTYNPELYLPS